MFLYELLKIYPQFTQFSRYLLLRRQTRRGSRDLFVVSLVVHPLNSGSETTHAARGHLRVQKLVTPYALRASWYVNQVMEILGRPSLDNLAGLVVLPTTGKIPAPPPSWVHFEPIIVVKPPSTPPTNATPVSTLLTRTRGHHSLPAPKVARHRAGSAGSVSRAWSKFQIEKVICIASAFVLIVMSLVRRFATALPSVNSIKHQGLENDDAVFCKSCVLCIYAY
jgi:hypothetical protein